ncbi:sigma-70 family RNA polymerase sigma factor [Paenibacillus sp. FSL E2-0178]|uniref:sigma-70 family RNA polymerase sigma factor n=1 Tax=Paenibacillus sp. FSL E2-0178 TaxID=2921361 RepID=UPI0031597841
MNLKQLKRDPKFNNENAIALYRKTYDHELREGFFKNNAPLVQQLARKWFNPNSFLSYDDLISFGFEGLLKAFNSFDQSKGIKCISFITLCIEREYIKALSKQKFKGRSKYNIVSLQSEMKIDKNSGVEHYLEDIVSDTILPSLEDEVIQLVSEDEFNKILINKMNDKQRMVAYKFFVDGKTFEEIGREVGITRQRAHQIHKKNIDLIKSDFNKEMAL